MKNKWIKIGLLILVGLGIVSVVLQVSLRAKETGLPSEFILYRSASGEFTMPYPENWAGGGRGLRGYDDVETAFMNLNSFPSSPIIIIYKKNIAGGNMQDVIDWGRTILLQDFNQYTDVEIQDVILDEGISATQMEYLRPKNASSEENGYHCYDLYLIHESNGYIFSCCSLEQQWGNVKDTFEEMFRQLEFE